jgi:hypothetical protein
MNPEEFVKRLSYVEEFVDRKIKGYEEVVKATNLSIKQKEEGLSRMIQQNEDLAGEIQQLQDEIMGYKHRVEMLSGMENLLREFANDAVNERLEQLTAGIKPLKGGTEGIDLTHVQTELTLKREKKPVKFNTETVRGKILWIAANDLKGRWAVGSEYLEAAQERGWSLKSNSLYPAIAEMATKGLLGQKKVEKEYAYRLSEDVKIIE